MTLEGTRQRAGHRRTLLRTGHRRRQRLTEGEPAERLDQDSPTGHGSGDRHRQGTVDWHRGVLRAHAIRLELRRRRTGRVHHGPEPRPRYQRNKIATDTAHVGIRNRQHRARRHGGIHRVSPASKRLRSGPRGDAARGGDGKAPSAGRPSPVARNGTRFARPASRYRHHRVIRHRSPSRRGAIRPSWTWSSQLPA